MNFIAIDKDRSFGDSDGKGWPAPSRAKIFVPLATLEDVWEWYKKDRSGTGTLEICVEG